MQNSSQGILWKNKSIIKFFIMYNCCSLVSWVLVGPVYDSVINPSWETSAVLPITWESGLGTTQLSTHKPIVCNEMGWCIRWTNFNVKVSFLLFMTFSINLCVFHLSIEYTPMTLFHNSQDVWVTLKKWLLKPFVPKKKNKKQRETSQITWNGFLCWQTLSLLMNFDTSCRSC